jgi:L-threonylcarbamoyladenylate synthase
LPTDLLEIDVENPAPEALARAARVIRRGGLLAMPSDALYTLVADPFSLKAVGRVFEAKGREFTRALPLVVSDVMMAEDLAKETSNRFYILARHFWPGPLTMIVPAAARVPLKVTGNTGRLAMRQPKAKLLQLLIETLDQPLISTSANISGQPTCRSGIEAFGILDSRVDLVLDGGLCTGAGATTVDITEPYWRLIKQGAVPEKEIAECLQGT